jgi:hypothetical protein
MISDDRKLHKKKSDNLQWRFIFILLFILNLLGYSWFLWALSPIVLEFFKQGLNAGAIAIGFYLYGSIGVYTLFPLHVTNNISVVLYIVRKHPHGISKIISCVVLIILSLLSIIGVILFLFLLRSK